MAEIKTLPGRKIPTELLIEAIDILCGAGGGTSGMEDAEVEGKKVCNTIACINHWPTAIKTHKANYPHIQHFVEDIEDFDVKRFRSWTSGAWRYMLAGVECTQHSIAKGGMPRDADSRVLAEHLYRYVKYLDLDFITIENVKEFKLWGPIIPKISYYDKKGHLKKKTPPEVTIAFFEANENNNWKLYTNDGNIYFCPLIDIKEKKKTRGKKRTIGLGPWLIPHPIRKGEDYQKWLKKMDSFGYWHEERIINAADYGARTIRKRLFITFAKKDLPIEWPKPTHSKDGIGGKKKWLPVKPVLDLNDEGYSIFGREYNENIPIRNRQSYVESTLERLFNGCLKHVVGASEDEFIVKAMGNQLNGTKSNGKSVNEPSLSVTTHGRMSIAKVIREDAFLLKWIGDRKEKYCHRNINDPAPTVVTQNRLGLVSITREADKKKQTELFGDEFLMAYHGNGDNTQNLENPAFTVLASDALAKVKCDKFIVKNFSGKPKYKNSGIDEPLGSITTQDHNSLVNTKSFLDIQFGSGKRDQSLEEPCGSLVQNPKQKLVQAFIVDANYKGNARSIDEPAATILACRKHHYLVNPQYDSKGQKIDQPCFTLIAEMGKRPPYVVTAETGEVNIVIYEDDSPMTKKLKILMAVYGIVDIKMRMLKDKELLRIQDFRANYKMFGNQTDRKKQIGNAIVRRVAKVITESLYKGLLKHVQKLAA